MNIERVGVVGAGTMGSALAQKFSQEGIAVIMVDREEHFLKAGLETIRATLKEGLDRGLFSPERVASIQGRITPTTRLEDLAPCQIVVEAVFEDFSVKEKLFRRLGSSLPAEVILATNTSSFSINALSQGVSHPERFLGLHFFYHAAKNRLVEVVRGEATTEDVFQAALWFMQRCGKDPIVCRDAHGFVVNRFFVPWLNEAVRLFEEGLGGVAAIDAVARQTFGCGMGPFALMNATGVAIACKAQETLAEAYGDFYRPAATLRNQAEEDRPWDLTGEEEVEPTTADRIARRLLGVVFLTCGQLLDEGVGSAGDINRGARIGLRWRKGPLDHFQAGGAQRAAGLVKPLVKAWGLSLPRSLRGADWRYDHITTTRRNGTGLVIINRPEDLNALNLEVVTQLEEGFDTFEGDNSIATIICTGRGKAFMAGADVKFFLDRIRSARISEILAFTTRAQELFSRIADSSRRVVMVVNGLALGGGLELALTGDQILALKGARLAFPETGLGIYPGLGGTQRTVDRIGPGLTKYLVYTGRMVRAEQAYEIGLVDGVIGWEELKEVLAGRPPAAGKRPQPAERWVRIADFFERYPVTRLLGADPSRHRELGAEEWLPIVNQVRTKAPRALEVAERLIDAHRGPASELEYLVEVFSTEDARSGLGSVGREAPRFVGR